MSRVPFLHDMQEPRQPFPPIPPVVGLARLARMAFDGADMAPVWERLTATLKDGASGLPEKYAALTDMCLVDQMRGDADRGLAFQAQALAACRLYQIPAATYPPRLTVLCLLAAGRINANAPIEFLIQDADVTLLLMYVVPGLPLPPVPPHDLAFVLTAYCDEAWPVLRELERLLADWPRPVLNRPALIPQMGRERLHRALSPLDGVEIPATVRVGRADMEAFLPDGGFPVIVRPLDSHAGDGLEKIEGAAGVASYLARHAEREFHLSRFVDYRSPDGLYRKYRVMVIDGEAFPAHMAASDHWMIHYLNAGMLGSAEKRADEARFMDRFRDDFGLRHRPALAQMAEVLGLDYFGIDCAETRDGRLLVFEASTALVVHDMDPPETFPYKGRHMRALFDAFRALLLRRAEAGEP